MTIRVSVTMHRLCCLILALTLSLAVGQGRAVQAKGDVVLEDSSDGGSWASFTRDGTLLAADCNPSLVKIWDVIAGRPKMQILNNALCFGTAAPFSSDARLLATVVNFDTIEIWDLSTKRVKSVFQGSAEIVMAVAFSPDGKWLASANSNDTVSLWELASGTERTLRGHTSTVLAVAFSNNSKFLASGSRDRTVKLWDVNTAAEKTCINGDVAPVTAVHFGPNGKFLVSENTDLRAKAPNARLRVTIWDLPSAKERAHYDGVGWPVVSHDGRFLATMTEGGGIVQVWDTSTARETSRYKFAAPSRGLVVTFRADGNLLAVVKTDSQLKLLQICVIGEGGDNRVGDGWGNAP